MRRMFASFQRVQPRRFGAVLALVALLAQLALPSAAALAMGADPLRGAPICRTAHDGSHPTNPHKTVHAGCPLCQAPAAAWGFLPPTPAVLAGPYRRTIVIWQAERAVASPDAVTASRARGPPTTA
jgi:hypothetical protein